MTHLGAGKHVGPDPLPVFSERRINRVPLPQSPLSRYTLYTTGVQVR